MPFLRGPTLRALLPLVISIGAAIALFWPALAGGRVLAFGDGLLESVPAFFAMKTRWNPAMLGGFPIYADSSKAFWNPLRLLPVFTGGFNAYVMAANVIAAYGVYRYVYALTGVALASIAGAAIFAYGGFEISQFGHPMIAQPAAWACVALFALDAFLRTRHGLWLAALAGSEAMCLASGQPQPAAFALTVLFAYLLWMGFERTRFRATLLLYAEGIATIVLGVALAGIAWLPAIAQGTVSVRSAIDFRGFVEYSLPFAHLARMLTFPFAAGGGAQSIYATTIAPLDGIAFVESACYVGLGALVLAALAPFSANRRAMAFWFAVAVTGLALSLGGALPLAAFTFLLPGFNLFRIPGRHAFELTLAIAMLAGLGISVLASERFARSRAARITLVASLLAAVAIAGLATLDVSSNGPGFQSAAALRIFAWAFGAQCLLLLAAGVLPINGTARASLGCAAVLAGIVPFAATSYWRDVPQATILQKPAYARFIETLPLGTGQRDYLTSGAGREDLDANLPTIWGVPDVGGYTALQYAAVHVILQTGEDGRLLDVASPAVNLAAVRYFAAPAQTESSISSSALFDAADLQAFLAKGRPEAVRLLRLGFALPHKADRVVLVSALGTSTDIPQGRTVAIVTVRGARGAMETLPLRAGIETSEFAFNRPDVRPNMRHRQAPVYEDLGQYTWYQCSIPIHLREPVASVSIAVVNSEASLNLRKISLVDDPGGDAYPLNAESPYYSDARHFRHVADSDGIAIFENLQALPGAWIASAHPFPLDTTSTESLTALREGLRDVDLRHEAFTTTDPANQTASGSGNATIEHDGPEARDVAVTCDARCLVVSSATFTPDWAVAVDGRQAANVRVDGFLQGAFAGPGRHLVTFRYEPRAGGFGVAVSCSTAAALIIWLFIRERRRAPKRSTAT